MLVPVQGGVQNLQKRNRTFRQQEASLARANEQLPKVYIFNVGPRRWQGVGGGKSYVVPPCPEGAPYSEPIVINALCLSERDLADGGNNLDTITDAALDGVREYADGSQEKVFGVANDIIGTNSSAPSLDLTTTNGEWFGIFASEQNPPSEAELDQARGKLMQMMDLIYATGAQKVSQGEAVAIIDRARYNEAAQYTGRKQLWGSLEHTRSICPECREDIIEGATFCKHCQQAIDPASVAARARKRAKANEAETSQN